MHFGIAAALILLLGTVIYYWLYVRTYHGFREVHSIAQTDTLSSRYLEMNGNVLRCTTDEVMMLNRKLDVLWSYTYHMTNPVASVKGTRGVVADMDGTSLVILSGDGVTGTVNTSYTIVKAAVSRRGLVAVVLDGGEDTYINFYGADGSLIAETQTTMEDPGYPLDLDLSDNGIIMMVAYQYVKGSATTSYVAFYNFGDVGQNADDRIVSGYTYEGTVIPQIECLDANRSVAFRDDGFTLYSGNQVPKEGKTISVKQEIVSTFCDEETIGLIFKSDSMDSQYRMQVYSSNGDLKFTKDFNFNYTQVKMSRGYILLSNTGQLMVLTGSGKQRFFGAIDGTLRSCLRVGINRYLLVMDSQIRMVGLY